MPHLLPALAAASSAVLSFLEWAVTNTPDALAGAVGTALAGYFFTRVTLSALAHRFLKHATIMAYHLVEEEALVTKDAQLDKAALFLRELAAVFAAHGRPEPTEAEKARAILQAKVMHGEAKLSAQKGLGGV